jgi:hypothetical protein
MSPVSLMKIFFGFMSPKISKKFTYTESSGMSSSSCLNQYIKQKPKLFFLKGKAVKLSVCDLFIKQKRKIIKLQFQDTSSSTKALLLILTFYRQVKAVRRDRFLYCFQGLFPLMIRLHVSNWLTDLKISSLILESANSSIYKFGVFR